ncbi:MAG: glycosyltransferase family 4 protein, partial [Actinomycetes bacterium]
MRIGIIAPPWMPIPPPSYGGIEMVVDVMARGLVAAGHEVLLAAPADSTCPVPMVPGLPPSQRARLGAAAVELPYVLSAYAGMSDVDVIHDHTVTGPFCAPRPLPAPVVTTNHAPFDSEIGVAYRYLPSDVALVAISRSQAAAAVSTQVCRVIHHGIDVSAVPVGPGDGGYVSFLGRMDPGKGVREAALVARAAGVPLKIAAKMSEAPEREYFESQVQPLLGEDVEYVGELGPADKYRLVGEAQALLNPLQWPEPFGLVMVEALACGTPVVTTPCGAAPEIVEDGVTGFVRDSAAALTAALKQADRLDRAACRRSAETAFSAERMV